MIHDTPEAINRYVMVTLKRGIKLYLKTGMKPNRLWTPANMLKTASKYTKKVYKRGQLQQAHDDLEGLLNAQ